VRSDGLAVRSEQVVYEAVMGWVRRDEGSRKAWLGEVLGAVRMALLPTSYLGGTVGVDPLVMESFEALRIFAEANRDSQLRGVQRAAAVNDGRLRKRKHAPGGELVVVGGYDTGDSGLKSMEMYDRSTGEWRALPEMSVKRGSCAAVSIEGNLYVVGGWNGPSRSALKSAEMYDRSTREWRALPEMSVAREGCAAVSIEGNVYVVGGSDGHSELKSAEMYDGSTRQWRALPEMSVARGGCAAVSIEGNLYVVGGSDGKTRHASAECYDPVANEWRTLPSMSTRRWRCAAAAAELGHE
jgi:hypothetical protein